MGIYGHKLDIIKNENNEILNERTIVTIEGLGKIGCYENETRNNAGTAAYFKVITKDGTARIKFSEPGYVIHHVDKPKYLNKSEKKKLMSELIKQDKEGKSLWDKLNDEYEIMTKEKSIFRDHIPDYTKLPNK